MTLEEIQRQIAELIQENTRGANALFEAETKLAEAEHELDLVEQKAFISAEGSVADRTAIARLKASDARLQRDLRKAEANRVRVKIKQIESALIALATQAKLVGVEFRA
jgi:Tfp pilus assembly protein PilX